MDIWYNVAPRYTPGSPAMVPSELAERVAQEEKRAYDDTLEWELDPDHSKAKEKGCAWIVWAQWELHGYLHKRCLITGETTKSKIPF